MQSNKYMFCGCAVEIQSDEIIKPEAEFSKFLSDFTQADYTVRVIHTDNLPTEVGKPVFRSNRKKIYADRDSLEATKRFIQPISTPNSVNMLTLLVKLTTRNYISNLTIICARLLFLTDLTYHQCF